MTGLPSDLARSFQVSGFALLDDLVSNGELPALQREADLVLSEAHDSGGARNVFAKSRLFRELAASSSLADLATLVLGDSPRPTKLTVFDKTASANWKVPWHQDLTIAVRERHEVEGFGPWSLKEGVLHVQPPASILAQVLAIRLHLDDAPLSNGALRVLPGTHKLGRLSRAQIVALRKEIAETACPVRAGGGMLMSPLLLHASSRSTFPGRRRVLHFEYSSAELPGALEWAERG